MPKRLSTREFVNALRAMGFVEKAKAGSHLMLRHHRTGLLVTLPTDRAFVPIVHIRAITEQLRNYRITTPEEFRRVLEN